MYGGSIFTICVSAKNVVDVWRKGTGKQSNLAECFRPWGETLFRFISFINLLPILAPLLLSFVVMTLWLFYITPYDILNQCTRLVLALTGVVFANIAVRRSSKVF